MNGQMATPEPAEGRQPGRRLRYVLITPARNEEANIERVLQSMVAQTVKPLKWVIVSDGSTDGTTGIVQKYCSTHNWIELVQLPERKERHFAAKVNAFNAGYALLKDVDHDLVGSMDADISFDADYFEFLLDKFEGNAKLGLGGTPFKEDGLEYDFRYAGVEHVSGALQLFRRECFEQIGGYVAVESGGIDVIAVWSARARGWQTRTHIEKSYRHHRKMGTAKDGILKVKFKDGRKDYELGTHPLWEIFRVGYQMTKAPLLVGGCALGLGYLLSALKRVRRPMSPELVQFRRADQMRRLKALFLKPFTSGSTAKGQGGMPAASRGSGH